MALHKSNNGKTGMWQHLTVEAGANAVMKAVRGPATPGRTPPPATALKDKYVKLMVIIQWRLALVTDEEEADAFKLLHQRVDEAKDSLRVAVGKVKRKRRLMNAAGTTPDIFPPASTRQKMTRGGANRGSKLNPCLDSRLELRLQCHLAAGKALHNGDDRLAVNVQAQVAFAISMAVPPQRKVLVSIILILSTSINAYLFVCY